MKHFMCFPPIPARALALLLSGVSVFAQTAATDPVGFISDTIPANSDAAVTAPLTRPPVFQGSIASIVVNTNTITVTGTPAWTTSPKQFVHVAGTQPNTYYAQIGNGAKAGMYAAISDNGSNSLVVQLNAGDDLTGIATEATAGTGNGAKVVIIPFRTPATLFPANWPAGTKVLLYDESTAGVNQSDSQTLIYSGTQWSDNGTGQDASELLIHPLDSFIVRNSSNNPIDRIVLGSVPMVRHRSVIIPLVADEPQDFRIAYSSPAPELIGNSSLGFTAGDKLLVFDNAAAGQNKAASQTLIFSGTQWFDNGTGQNVHSTFSLVPGHGYVLRKAGVSNVQPVVWQDSQTYNP